MRWPRLRGGGTANIDGLVERGEPHEISEIDLEDPRIAGLDFESATFDVSNFLGVDQVPELHGTCVATGRELHAAYTDDDGTCALHSVWGGPVRTTTATVLHCTQARVRIVGGIVE